MRTHLKIIEDAGGYQKLAEALGLPNERVRFWVKRESIPTEFLRAVAKATGATLDELLGAVETKKLSDQEAAA